jgi:hypothetical protein
MTSHTPGKLRVVTERTRPNQGFAIRGEGAALIAETVEDHETVNGQANAERLVHCWNCHDEMLAALKEVDRLTHTFSESSLSFGVVNKVAAEAIAKAEGK